MTGYDGKSLTMREFDPSSSSGKKWLDTMANQQVKTGTKCHHISNNAPGTSVISTLRNAGKAWK